jgi:type IV pilus assembly protein PilZ
MQAKQAIQERRRSRRRPFVIHVNYSTVDEVFSDFSENINEGGMFIVTTKHLEPGAEVRLEFSLPGGEQPVRVKGKVVFVRSPEEATMGPPGIGVQFGDLDPEAREQINEIVKNLRVC